MMMFADPFRMMVVPPRAITPDVALVIVTVIDAPLGIYPRPLGMMVVNPSGMIVMPPVRVMPFMMRVPVAVMTVMIRVSGDRRSREQRSQSGAGEKCSKFHCWYLLRSEQCWVRKYLT